MEEKKDLDCVAQGRVSQRSGLKRSESNLTADMQKKYQNQVAKNESLRREKSDVVVVLCLKYICFPAIFFEKIDKI